ncbi:Di-copper centre-containing protein [Fistulina hepatica ATCC 64428]|uniref:Di-copper centre-containing protein n=1 Tax=Fistulina hepatica ATCC 64428 TaxID=1128425 RepID=A0A0D7AR41_9AGAR|nr:Di-copper centre-containing protein [Fistulina hepatica ATCC 64428]
MNDKVQFAGHFLPFHRLYVVEYEEALRNFCNYTGPASPYWNWTIDAANIEGSNMFTDSSPSGLRGRGDPNNDYSLYPGDGGFSNFYHYYPSPHVIRRNFTLYPFATEGKDSQVDRLINSHIGDFKSFQAEAEVFQSAHTAGHQMMGGDMGRYIPFGYYLVVLTRANRFVDALFWLHHSMVDKVWWEWQNAHPANAWAFEGGATVMLENATIYAKYPNGGAPFMDLNTRIPDDNM